MTLDVLKKLAARPFEPFVVVMSSGQRYEVPTAEHAGLNPARKRIVIWFDDGSGVVLSGLHITSIEEPGPVARE